MTDTRGSRVRIRLEGTAECNTDSVVIAPDEFVTVTASQHAKNAMVRSIILALALPATNAFVPGTKISPRLERMKIKSEL